MCVVCMRVCVQVSVCVCVCVFRLKFESLDCQSMNSFLTPQYWGVTPLKKNGSNCLDSNSPITSLCRISNIVILQANLIFTRFFTVVFVTASVTERRVR